MRATAASPIARAVADVVDRVFARIYDRVLAGFERGGMAEARHALLAQARGRTLEIGAGTGANLVALAGLRAPGQSGSDAGSPLHSPLHSLVLVEPVAPMRRRLAERLAATRDALPADTRIVAATADALPAEDGTIDTVICTLVLCSVPDQATALREIRRVLAPGGRLLLVEHVAAQGRHRRRQELIDPVWRHIGRGCRLTRDTRAALIAAGFDTTDVHDWRLPSGGRFAPAIAGTATLRER